MVVMPMAVARNRSAPAEWVILAISHWFRLVILLKQMGILHLEETDIFHNDCEYVHI